MCDVIEVRRRISQDLLAWRVVAIQYFDQAMRQFAKNVVEHCRIEPVLVAEIVIKEGLVDAGRASNRVSARARETFFREFNQRSIKNARTGLLRLAPRTELGRRFGLPSSASGTPGCFVWPRIRIGELCHS